MVKTVITETEIKNRNEELALQKSGAKKADINLMDFPIVIIHMQANYSKAAHNIILEEIDYLTCEELEAQERMNLWLERREAYGYAEDLLTFRNVHEAISKLPLSVRKEGQRMAAMSKTYKQIKGPPLRLLWKK